MISWSEKTKVKKGIEYDKSELMRLIINQIRKKQFYIWGTLWLYDETSNNVSLADVTDVHCLGDVTQFIIKRFLWIEKSNYSIGKSDCTFNKRDVKVYTLYI